MITSQQLEAINAAYPNSEAYKALAGLNLTLPQFISGNRGCMACQFYEHMVPLIHPESATIPTGFEKSYGKYTDSYKVADADYKVIAVLPKYAHTGRFKYIYIVQNINTKVYDIIDMSHYECLSEMQGYLRPYTDGDKYEVGNIIRKGSTLYKSNNHDEYGNYRYGSNPNVCFISLAENEEDGMILSQSYYENTTFYNFKKNPMTLNKNQILLDFYGENGVYKCFPDIGEEVKDGILYVKRTINYANAAAELTDNALKTIVSNDEICHGEGYVADIDVWVNDRTEFEDSINKTQILKYYSALVEYYTKVFEVLDPIVNASQKSKVQYTHLLRYTYEHAKNYLDTNIQWLNNNNGFEFAYIVITTYEEKHLLDGYKITDRFGGKGVVNCIWPDEYMPVDQYGNRADIILSPPSPIARANPGQNYEHEYSFIAGEIAKRITSLPDMRAKEALLVEFVSDSNPKEGGALVKFLSGLTMDNKIEFFNDIAVNGIYLVEEPFGGTISIDNLDYLYTKYKVVPTKITMKRVFKEIVTGLPIENENLPSVNMATTKNSYIMKRGFNKDFKGVTPFDFDKNQKYAISGQAVVPIINANGEIEYQGVDALDNTGDFKGMTQMKTVKAELNEDGNLVRTYESENNIIIGKKYYIVLKQNPDDKFSARSLGSTNQVGIPNKPSKQVNLMSPYSKPAIRNGEMENDNLFVRIDNEIVHRYMATHSTNPEMRERLAKMLLTEDPMDLHDLDIDSADIKDDIPALMLHSTLFCMGIEIVPIYEGDEVHL